MGMDKSHIRKMYITENAFILIPAGIAGILLALIAGSVTGHVLEAKTGYEFYSVNVDIVIKSVCSVIVAVVIEELTGLISNIKFYRKRTVKKKQYDRRKENIKLSILKHSIISIAIMIALIISSIIKIEISYRMIVNLIKYF